MSLFELFLIAAGLSMDAFAASVCTGLKLSKSTFTKSLTVGLYFGIFQALMPLIGYFLGSQFADKIKPVDHWIAFGLLIIIGGKMIFDSFKKEPNRAGTKSDDRGGSKPSDSGGNKPGTPWEPSLLPARMLPLAIATSIDALAVGVTLAFLEVDIASSASFIGVTTLVLSMIGVQIGSLFGTKFKSKAELSGGIILLLIGIKILVEHIIVD